MAATDALAIKCPFPRDADIALDETDGKHVYTVRGVPYTLSVTAVVESVYPVFDDAKVLAGMRARGTIGRAYAGKTDAQIARMWREGAETASRYTVSP